MRPALARSVLATTAALCAGAAAAQSSTQWRTAPANDRFRATAAIDAAREMNNFARCIASRRYGRARSVVLAPYASVEQARAANQIVMNRDDPCMLGTYTETRMRFSGEVLAGALGQALVLKDYADLPVVVQDFAAASADEDARIAQLNPAEIFGRCVVQRDPASTLALFNAVRGTDEEQRAFERLLDDFGPCLASGSTLRVNKLFVRNVLGVAAYRLAQQARPRGQTQAGAAQ